MEDDKAPKDAEDTTGAGIEAIVEGEKDAVTDKKKAVASEKQASTFAESIAAMIVPTPGAGRYEGGDEP